MKKIFTLLFCVATMALSASAQDEGNVERCINVVLNGGNSTMMMAANLDANLDGVIDVADVTKLIEARLAAASMRAPRQQADVNALIQEALNTSDKDPNVEDVNQAIDNNANKD